MSALVLQMPERARVGVGALSGRGRPVADLRRDAHRQLRARLVLHARPLRRRRADRRARAPARSASGAACCSRRSRSPSLGALIEVLAPAPHLRGARAVPAARDLRARAGHPRRGAVRSGARRTCSARVRPAWRARSTILGKPLPELRRALDLRSARSCSAALWLLLDAHALGHCWCAPRRRTARWSARSASTRRWLFTGVFALGALLAGARRRAADAARAGQPHPRPRPDRRRVRGRRGRRHGLDPRRVRRGAADREIKAFCIGIGTVDVFGVAVLAQQAHAGRRVPRHGGRAGRRPWGLLGSRRRAVRATPAARDAAAAAAERSGALAGIVALLGAAARAAAARRRVPVRAGAHRSTS